MLYLWDCFLLFKKILLKYKYKIRQRKEIDMIFKTRKEWYLSELQKSDPSFYEYVKQKQKFKEQVSDFSEKQKREIENIVADSIIEELSLLCKQKIRK